MQVDQTNNVMMRFRQIEVGRKKKEEEEEEEEDEEGRRKKGV